MTDKITSGTCATCKHYRTTEMRTKDSEIVVVGYCHATSNFANREPSQTCKRWAASPKSIEHHGIL